jgi:hypothetical protein
MCVTTVASVWRLVMAASMCSGGWGSSKSCGVQSAAPFSQRATAKAAPLLAERSKSGNGSKMLKMPAVMEKARAPPPPNEIACAIFAKQKNKKIQHFFFDNWQFFLQVFFFSPKKKFT